jgi:3-phenylpropionate/cinnamic acid dioxygenase small subunit
MDEAKTIGLNDPLYSQIVDFLYKEAELIDDGRFSNWLEQMTEDLSYHMPLRVNRGRGVEPDYSDKTEIFCDDLPSLRLRIDRLSTEYAWAEDPPSRTRHVVSNIQVSATSNPDEFDVRSYILVYRNRGNSPQGELFSGKRQDLLRNVNGHWRLARRTILLDQAVIGSRHLSIFF